MIRVTYQQVLANSAPTEDGSFVSYIEAAGLSTDTKPEDKIATGSLFLEVDTGDVYAFDEDGGTWGQIAALGGGA